MSYLVADVPEATLRRWWREGDAVLRRHALLCMDAIDCPDIVLAVAKDATHKLHAEALGRMMFFFEMLEHQAIKIAALAHPEARVREVAACVVLYDEPVRAEEPLIRATGDPVSEVAAEAANTLEYYRRSKPFAVCMAYSNTGTRRFARRRAKVTMTSAPSFSTVCVQGTAVSPHISAAG